MKKVILPLLLCASAAHAGDLSLTLPIACKHLGQDISDSTHYNETNLGLGVEYKNFGVLYYNNSYSKPSVVAYYNLESPVVLDYFSVGARLGGVTGYEQFTGYKITPAIQPYVSFHYKEQSVQVGVLPTGIAADSTVKAVITLDYQYNF